VSGTGTMARRRHELLADVEQSAASAARELGVPDDVARHVGAAMADLLLERWAGQQLTFPMNGYYALADRERAIVERRAQGARLFELAREFRMSERGVRKLLKRVDEGRARMSEQMDMFRADSGGSDQLPQP